MFVNVRILMLQIQFIAYNSDLYKSMADAIQVPYGIAIIAVFVEVRRREKSIVDARSSHEIYGMWHIQMYISQEVFENFNEH